MSWLFRGAVLILLLATTAVASAWLWLRGSLPILEGELRVAGIDAAVTIARDAQGIPHIRGRTRADIGHALGFLHAQERFFQMDLLRRSAAGELSELFGEAALDHDRRVRRHRFRARARRNTQHLPAHHRQVLERYAAGVNAGLQALRRPPFEYALLGVGPRPWLPEDSNLVLFSMFLELQDDQARFERGLGLMADALPADLFAFFSQQGGRWDAPLSGQPLAPAPMPRSGWDDLPGMQNLAIRYRPLSAEDTVAGSNNWAVAGRLTGHGGALVANDMHLRIEVPNIWYRAAWTDPASARTVSGVTLPGGPALITGSNGRLAWGFTNTQGDWSDVIVLQTDDQERYRGRDGFEDFVQHQEQIVVKGGSTVGLRVRETRWGPVIGSNHRGEQLALRWVAHDARGCNLGLLELERADSVATALELAPDVGIPHQNLVLGDDRGNIGWTVLGPVPRRVGLDGRLPRHWSEDDVGWNGYHDRDRHPRIYNPESGRLWSANARTVSGAAYRLIGGQGMALGARQQQIRDRLAAHERFAESDFLRLQLDDRAVFLAPWRQHLLALLDQQTVAGSVALQQARQYLENWTGRAAREDVGYRLVRQFRLKVIELALAPLASYLEAIDGEFDLRHVSRQFEYPVWGLLQARPTRLLNPDYASWRDLELDAVTQVLEPLFADGDLADDSWGAYNRLQIRHPLARVVAPLDWWLSMPRQAMDGDSHMPRVQAPSFGASERFAVAPGREEEAFLHMATGQSAHPLSPFFASGHRDWVEGRASAWLPGAAQYRLRLLPQQADP